MKNAMKKLLSLMLVVMLLLSVVPFQAFADGEEQTGEENVIVPLGGEDEDEEEDEGDVEAQNETYWKVTVQIKVDNLEEDGETYQETVTKTGGFNKLADEEKGVDISGDLTGKNGEELLQKILGETFPLDKYDKGSWWYGNSTKSPVITGDTTVAIRLTEKKSLKPVEEPAEPEDDVGTTAKIYFTIEDKDFDETNYLIKTVTKDSNNKTIKIGSSITGFPTEKEALAQYAKVHGSSANVKFMGWYLKDTETLANGRKVQKTAEVVTARFETRTRTLTLDPKGGVLTPAQQKISVVIGGTYPELPVPTRNGYAFKGWYIEESGVVKQIHEGDLVNSAATPYAKWSTGNYTVTLQRYNFSTNEWEAIPGFEDMAVPAGSTLKTSNGLWPTTSQINSLVKDLMPSAYNIDKGWKVADTGAAFEAGKTQVKSSMVIRPRYQRSVTLIANHPEDINKGNFYKGSKTVEIGSRIGKLPYVGPCYISNDSTSYTLEGWYNDENDAPGEILISSRENLSDSSKHPVYYPTLGDTFQANWTEATAVMLYFHKGSTASVAGVECYEIPSEGTFDLNKLDLYKYCKDYSKYDDGVDVRSGWYTQSQWANYLSGKPAVKISSVTDVGQSQDSRQLHILLIDKGTDANKYNNNNSTADKTNPKTGDIIITAVVVMGASAAALAGAYYVTKKRSTK